MAGIDGLFFAIARAAGGAHERAEDLVLDGLPALVIALRDARDGFHGVHADHGLHLFAQLALLRIEEFHALFEVARKHSLKLAAIGTDDLREEITAHHRIDS